MPRSPYSQGLWKLCLNFADAFLFFERENWMENDGECFQKVDTWIVQSRCVWRCQDWCCSMDVVLRDRSAALQQILWCSARSSCFLEQTIDPAAGWHPCEEKFLGNKNRKWHARWCQDWWCSMDAVIRDRSVASSLLERPVLSYFLYQKLILQLYWHSCEEKL